MCHSPLTLVNASTPSPCPPSYQMVESRRIQMLTDVEAKHEHALNESKKFDSEISSTPATSQPMRPLYYPFVTLYYRGNAVEILSE